MSCLHPISISLVVIALVACKPNSTSESNVKTNQDAKEAIDFGFQSLDMGAKEAICDTNAMIVYVGNAESMGSYDYADGLGSGKSEHSSHIAKAHQRYFKTIQQSASELRDSLATNDCDPSWGTSVTLLSIIDGPTRGDSKISVSKWGFQRAKWVMLPNSTTGKAETAWYQVKDDTLKPANKDDRFEILLPKHLTYIIEQTDKANGPHEQIIYFLKTHGGLVSNESGSAPGLLKAASEDNAGKKDRGHALLFDANGPDGEVQSGLYSYFWTNKNACTIFRDAKDKKKYTKAGCSKVLGVFQGGDGSPTQGGDGSPTQGGDGSPTQGGDGSPTQGGDGSPTQGGDGSPTQGGDGSPTQGGDGSPTQGGDGSPTQGGDGSPTQGGDGSPTQGVGANTQGPGKSLMYISSKRNQPDLASGANEAKPNILLNVGAVASYDLDGSSGLKNIYPLKLPQGTKPDKKPTLISLDSCYGSDKVIKAAFSESTKQSFVDSGKAKRSLVCALSNPVPTYTHTMNYGLLNSSGYLTLSQSILWDQIPELMPDSAEQISEMGINLYYAFVNPGLETKEEIKKKYKQEGIDINKIKDEYVELYPECKDIKN